MDWSRRFEIPLWASGFVLAGLVALEAGRGPGDLAYAGDAVITRDGYSLVTARTAVGAAEKPIDFLYLIDGRDEMLYVYEVPGAPERRVVMRGGVHLPTLFAAGRGN